MIFDGKVIDTMTFFTDVDGDIYPEADLPENARKLRGFVWRGDERIKTKEEIFPPEEDVYDLKAQKDKDKKALTEDLPMEPTKATLEYDQKNPTPKVLK